VNMPLTRARAQQIRGNKTGRGALCDISANPQQAKKQQTRRKAFKAFTVAEDMPVVQDLPVCDVFIENIEIDAMELSLGEEEEQEEQSRPEWYSPDPQFVSEYMNDIMACYRRSEMRDLPQHGYLSAHSDINEKMREILVDWLVEVHNKFNLQAAVLYTTVQLIDRFLSVQAVARSKLQLVGITAMLIASKMEEIYPPEVKDFVYISDKAYTQDEIIQMEQQMLNTLKFKVAFPTFYMFAQQIKVATMCSEAAGRVASYLMDMTLQDYATLRFQPSLMAAACVNLAERLDRGIGDLHQSVWTSAHEAWVGYTEPELFECMLCVDEILSQPRELKAVRKKYASSKWGKVSTTTNPLGEH